MATINGPRIARWLKLSGSTPPQNPRPGDIYESDAGIQIGNKLLLGMNPDGSLSGAAGAVAPNYMREFAVFGDSITQQNTYVISTAQWYAAEGYMTWACFLANQRVTFSPSNNFGISGQTTTQMLARIATVVGSNTSGVVFLGGTNDITDAAYNYQTTIDNITAIARGVINAGKTFIIVPILPRSGVGAAGRNRIFRVNSFIKNVLPTLVRGVEVADPTEYVVDQSDNLSDPIGKIPSNDLGAYTKDGLHPGYRLAFWIGYAVAQIINRVRPVNPLLFSSPADTYDATGNPLGNRLVNGMLNAAGTGTLLNGATGVVHSGWSVGPTVTQAGGAGTVVASKTTRTTPAGIVINRQTIVMDNSTGSGTMTTVFSQALTGTGARAAIGASVEYSAYLEYAGSTGCDVAYFEYSDKTATGRWGSIVSDSQTSGRLLPASASSGVARGVFAPVADSLDNSIEWRFRVLPGASLTVHISQLSARG